MMSYDSYIPMCYSDTKSYYDIMRGNCTSMKYLSDDLQVLIPLASTMTGPANGTSCMDK
jgi:hypothetical protein